MTQLFPNGVKGLADSKWSGVLGAAFRLVGLDFHSKPGLIKVAQKLTRNSGTIVTELCKSAVNVSDGSKLWFSAESGKIWREVSGTYTLVYENYIASEPFSSGRYFINFDSSLDQKLTITNASQNGLDLDNPYTTTVESLIVAGGGGGSSGGGGGGGVISNNAVQIASGVYAIVVGAGGAANTNGGDSSFSTLIAIGGGKGGAASTNGSDGGSGGGGGGRSGGSPPTGGSGTVSQGNNGGSGSTSSAAGGGGGAGGVGSNASGSNGGNGGSGFSSSITGSAVLYGGGGGGQGSGGGSPGTGTDGGGDGSNAGSATAGAANRGAGGGGSGGTPAAGGSGVVIIRYPTGTLTATGGTITTSGGYTIHTFTSSGNFEVVIHLIASFAAYINLRSVPSTDQYFAIAEKWNETGNQRSWRFGMFELNGRYYLVFDVSYTGSALQLQIKKEFTPILGEWVHVGLTFDQLNNEAKFFIDGVQLGTTVAIGMGSNPLFISTAGVGVGGQADNDEDYFDGYMSDLRIWNRILSPANFTSLFADPVGFSNGSNLIAHWKLNEDGTDESSNNNDLTEVSDDGDDIGEEADSIEYIEFGSNVAEEKTLDAVEFDEYIYWSTEARLRRIAVSDIGSTWTKQVSSGTGNVSTRGMFVNSDDTYHPMVEKNLSLFIGDKNIIASVTSNHVFINETDFNLPKNERITTLHPFDTDIIVGTIRNSNGRVLRWDTVSESWGAEDEVSGGVKAFLRDDNYVYAVCGDFGNLMFYNGEKLETYKKIPGEYSSTAKVKINPRAVGYFLDIPVIGVSNNIGNPVLQGIYSLGSYSSAYSKILDLTYPISSNNFSDVEIGSIIIDGADMYSSWKRNPTVTMTIANPAVVTLTDHNLSNGDAVSFTTTGALPTGVTSGTVYYARVVNTTTFNLYDTSAHAIAGGSTGRVTTSGTQSGTHSINISGVDKIDWSSKYSSAYLETVQLIPADNRVRLKTLTDFSAQYASLPTSTDITFKYEVNYSGSFTTLTSVKDTKIMQKRTNKSITNIGALRLRADFTVSSNNAPEVEDFSYFLADTKK